MLRVDDVYREPAYYNALHYTMPVSMIVKQPGMVLSFSTEGRNFWGVNNQGGGYCSLLHVLGTRIGGISYIFIIFLKPMLSINLGKDEEMLFV